VHGLRGSLLPLGLSGVQRDARMAGPAISRGLGTGLGDLEDTNPFPEFTGRVCPALCEASCVLGVNDEPVTIRQNELAVIEKAFEMGLVVPRPPKVRNGKKVAIVGGGPSGLSTAYYLNRAGFTVTVYEGDRNLGGYLRYGIPDFKLDKSFIDRRVALMEQEGITFKTNSRVGSARYGFGTMGSDSEFNRSVQAGGRKRPGFADHRRPGSPGYQRSGAGIEGCGPGFGLFVPAKPILRPGGLRRRHRTGYSLWKEGGGYRGRRYGGRLRRYGEPSGCRPGYPDRGPPPASGTSTLQ